MWNWAAKAKILASQHFANLHRMKFPQHSVFKRHLNARGNTCPGGGQCPDSARRDAATTPQIYTCRPPLPWEWIEKGRAAAVQGRAGGRHWTTGAWRRVQTVVVIARLPYLSSDVIPSLNHPSPTHTHPCTHLADEWSWLCFQFINTAYVFARTSAFSSQLVFISAPVRTETVTRCSCIV